MPAPASLSASPSTTHRNVSVALAALLGVAAILPAACKERGSSRPATSRATSRAVSSPVSSPEHFSAGPLSVRLHLPGRTYLEIEFFNSSSADVIVLRPGDGEPLAAVPGLPGMQVLPPALYQFQAVNLGKRLIQRRRYAPPFDTFADSERAHREKGIPNTRADYRLTIPAKGSARLTADLPFELEAGEYWLAFSYDYFTSSAAVPVGWFTGRVEAAPLHVAVGQQGDLSLLDQRGAAESAALNAGYAGLGITLKAMSPDVIEVRFTNRTHSSRTLSLPVDRAVEFSLGAPEFKWEAIAATTGQAFRHRVGDHTPREDEPEAALPPGTSRRPPPPETALVVPAQGEATLQLQLPWQLASGDYLIRLGYENLKPFSDLGSEAVVGGVVSAPLALRVSR